MLWDRGYWLPQGDPKKMLAKGDLKFGLDGRKLHGDWVLVRMKTDKYKSKRNNWLLIKHRDNYAHEPDGDAILKKDRSVASGRTMAAIKAGTGKKPRPFMRTTPFKADAVWQSKKPSKTANEDSEPVKIQTIRTPRAMPHRAKALSARPIRLSARPKEQLPCFVEPELCKLVERPPAGPGWIHEVKFDGFAYSFAQNPVMPVYRRAKGLIGRINSPKSPRLGPNCPTASSTGRFAPWTIMAPLTLQHFKQHCPTTNRTD